MIEELKKEALHSLHKRVRNDEDSISFGETIDILVEKVMSL